MESHHPQLGPHLLERHRGRYPEALRNLTLGQRILQSQKLRAVVSGHTHVGRSGAVTRPDAPDLPPIPVSVLASDYNSPVYQVVIARESQEDVE